MGHVIGAISIAMTVVVSACGGGGGGSDDRCEQYCLYFCQKVAQCGFIPQIGVRECASSCVETTEELNRSGDSCEQTQVSIQLATCHEMATILGLVRIKDARDGLAVAKEYGLACGQLGE